MAETFKNYLVAGAGTGDTNITTSPALTTTVGLGLTIANVTAAEITVSVKVTSGATTAYVVKDAPVPVGGALVVIGGEQKLVLEAGDVLKFNSSAAASADAVLSCLEIS